MQKNVVKNDLFDYENRWIFQYENSFKFSLDSILLSEYVTLQKKDVIIDFCTGLVPLPLILSLKYNNNIVGFELQKEIFDLARHSITYNGLEKQIKLINDDVKNVYNYFEKKSVDVITCNPPFFKIDDFSLLNIDNVTKISRHECMITLEDIFRVSSDMLKDCGKLYMIHRPERLDEIIILANKYNLKVKEIVNVITNDSLGIKTILIKCVKNSKFNVKIKAINVCGMKTYKNIFREES